MKSDNFICCIFDSRTVAGLQFSQFKLVLPTGTMSGLRSGHPLEQAVNFYGRTGSEHGRTHSRPGRVGSRIFPIFKEKLQVERLKDLL